MRKIRRAQQFFGVCLGAATARGLRRRRKPEDATVRGKGGAGFGANRRLGLWMFVDVFGACSLFLAGLMIMRAFVGFWLVQWLKKRKEVQVKVELFDVSKTLVDSNPVDFC